MSGGTLGKELLVKGIVSSDQLTLALREQAKSRQMTLSMTLISLGFASHDQLERTLDQLSFRLGPTARDSQVASFTRAQVRRGLPREGAAPKRSRHRPLDVINREDGNAR